MVTDPAAPEGAPEEAVYDLDADLAGGVVRALDEGRVGAFGTSSDPCITPT